MNTIPFNKPYASKNGIIYLQEAIQSNKLAGDGEFTKKCNKWLENNLKCSKALLTTSATSALEMSALLTGIKSGDEVIMPSFTFTSTANPFVLRGAKLKFIDIRPDTMNMDEKLIEAAITRKTRAICVVHYGGVACEMDYIQSIAKKHGLKIIEDAAHSLLAEYKNQPLGTIGNLGCFSFHETKNYTCGEGGALILKDDEYKEHAEIIREKGTNRAKFLRGQVDKYTWVELGSSYLPSELCAAYLYAQLEMAVEINNRRKEIWQYYNDGFGILEKEGKVDLQKVPSGCKPNGHLFYLKVKDIKERDNLIKYLKEHGVNSVFHYIPLHSAPAGKKYGTFVGEDRYTTKDSERLLRLPLYFELDRNDCDRIIQSIMDFFKH